MLTYRPRPFSPENNNSVNYNTGHEEVNVCRIRELLIMDMFEDSLEDKRIQYHRDVETVDQDVR